MPAAHRVLRSALLALAIAVALGCRPEPQASGAGPRVISLSPALTRIVLALEAGEMIVGVDRFSQQIEGMVDRPSLGGLFAPDLERAVELRPDLVLAIESAQQAPFLARMQSRGVRVETFKSHELPEVLESFSRIGALLGRAEAGVALSERVERELRELREQASELRPTVAVVIELDPLYVVGGGSFVSDLIEAAGGRNVFGDLEQAYPRVSLEALAERAPEVLLDTTFEPERGDGALHAAREYWNRFPWIQRVEVVAQGILTLPGPDLVDAARLLRDRIAP